MVFTSLSSNLGDVFARNGFVAPIVIVAIDIDIELISCFLSENSVEKLSGIHGGLPNAPHVRVSLV